MTTSARWNDAKCSFCGKSQRKVEKLIAGPDGVYICNECVGLCEDILDETLRGASPTVEDDASLERSPAHEGAVRNERRLLLSAKLRALENLDQINESVRACRDRGEAVNILTAAPFNFREIEAQTILDIGVGQQTVRALTRLRQEIADLNDGRDP